MPLFQTSGRSFKLLVGHVMDPGLPHQLSAPLVKRLVRDFYDAKGEKDAEIGNCTETEPAKAKG